MYGPLGTSEYTGSILDIISTVIPVTKPRHPLPPKKRQANPAQPADNVKISGRRNNGTSHTQGRQEKAPDPVSDTPCPSTVHTTTPTGSTPTVLQYAVKTFNRFSNFLS